MTFGKSSYDDVDRRPLTLVPLLAVEDLLVTLRAYANGHSDPGAAIEAIEDFEAIL